MPEGVRCLIIDCFGLLSSLYRYGRWAYVGGGFGKSVHNTLEAAVDGIPVLCGPQIRKHREVRELVARSSGFIVQSEAELSEVLDRFRDDEEAEALRLRTRAFFAEESGATEVLLQALFPA